MQVINAVLKGSATGIFGFVCYFPGLVLLCIKNVSFTSDLS